MSQLMGRGGVAGAITYELACGPDPWSKKPRPSAWVLWRETWIGEECISSVPVAVFDSDSEGMTFLRFLKLGGQVRPR